MRFITAAVAVGAICGAILACLLRASPAAAGPVLARTAAAGPVAGSAVAAAVTTERRITVTPDPSAPGTATTFEVLCGRSANSAALLGTTLGLAARIPMHSATLTGVIGDFEVTVTLPASIAPGTYRPGIACSNGFTDAATLLVNAVPGRGVLTGDGTTSTRTWTPLTGVGLGSIAIGLLVGAAALLRRPRPGSAR